MCCVIVSYTMRIVNKKNTDPLYRVFDLDDVGPVSIYQHEPLGAHVVDLRAAPEQNHVDRYLKGNQKKIRKQVVVSTF